MSEPRPPLDTKQLEALKAKHGVDQHISDKWGKPTGQVEKEFDPRLVQLLKDWLSRRSGKSND